MDNIVDFTPRSKRVIETSFIEARKTMFNYIGTEHILIGILREGDCIAAKILLDLNANIPKIYNEIIKTINEGENLDNESSETKSKKIRAYPNFHRSVSAP